MANAVSSRRAGPAPGGRAPASGLDQLILLFALLLSGVAGVNTFAGMERIFGSDHGLGVLGPAAAAAFTLCIQCALTAFGWIAGKDLAHALAARTGAGPVRRISAARRIVVPGVFLAAAAVSVFFSYSTYFNGLYEGPEELRRRAVAVPAFLGEVIGAVGEAVREAELDALRDDRRDAWLAGVEAVAAAAAAAAGPRLDEAARAEAEARRAAERERVAAAVRVDEERRTATASAAAAERTLAARREMLDRRLADLAELDGRLVEIDAAIGTAKAEQRREEAGVDGRKPGRGPKFASAQAAERRLDGERAGTAQVRDELAAAIEDDRRAIAAAESEARLAQRTAGAAEAPAVPVPDEPVEIPTDPALVRADLEAAVRAYRAKPDVDGHRRVAAGCELLRAALARDPATAPGTDRTACDDPAIARAAETFERSAAARRDFAARCSLAPVAANADFGAAIAFAEDCAALARLGGADTARTDGIVAGFAEGRGEGRHAFAKTLDSFAVAPDLALLAVFLAVFQDVLVFLLAFASDMLRLERRFEAAGDAADTVVDYAPRPEDPSPMRAAKAIVAGAVPRPGRRRRFDYVPRGTDAAGFEGDRANVDQLLARLVRERLARRHGGGPDAPAYEISEDGLVWLEDFVRRATPAAADRAGDEASGSGLRQGARYVGRRPPDGRQPPAASVFPPRPRAGAEPSPQSGRDGGRAPGDLRTDRITLDEVRSMTNG